VWRSRTSTYIGRSVAVVGLLLVALLALGCKKKPAYIAELIKADGPVERQEGSAEWGGASVGTKFYLGDAARTADQGAELKLGGAALIKMGRYTVLRFGGKGGSAKIAVELGEIELSGAGDFGLDLGDVKLAKDGAVRITAKGEGQSTIELLVGTAQLAGLDGNVIELELGKAIDLGIGEVQVQHADAGIDAAPVDAEVPDAAEVTDLEGTITVEGKRVEIQKPGSKKWEPLPPGPGQLVKGAALRVGSGSSAVLVANGVTLSLAGGSRMKLGDSFEFAMELGVATAAVPANTEGKVGVPGGSVDLKGVPNSGAKSRVDVNARGEAKVAVLEGGAKLVGTAPGAELELKTGESAQMAKAGNIQQKAKIPDYYDLKIVVGAESQLTIHDPRGATALQFSYPGKCGGIGTIEMDTDPKFRTARITAGKDTANILAEQGAYSYRLICGGGTVGAGRIVVRRDSGTRPLPKEASENRIDADGRTYRISYQSLIPNVKIKVPGAAGGKYRLHLATGGVDDTMDSTKSTFSIPGKKLKEATYTYWVERDGVKDNKVSTLIIDFDQTAPQVYISDPPNGKPFAAEVKVAGAVLPGWTAKVEGVEIPVDKGTRRFNATLAPPQGANALAIRLSHPQRGIHYYVRRGR
jgi:hypothetical protein